MDNLQTIRKLCTDGRLAGLTQGMDIHQVVLHLYSSLWMSLSHKVVDQEELRSFQEGFCRNPMPCLLGNMTVMGLTSSDVCRILIDAGLENTDGTIIRMGEELDYSHRELNELLVGAVLDPNTESGKFLRDRVSPEKRNAIISELVICIWDNPLPTEIAVDASWALYWLEDDDNDMPFMEWLEEAYNSRHPKFLDERICLINRAVSIVESGVAREAARLHTAVNDDFVALQSTFHDCICSNVTMTFSYPLYVNIFLKDYEDTQNFLDWVHGEEEPSAEDLQENSIVKLITQQGYTIQEYLDGKDTPFLNSLRQEMDAGEPYLSELVFCVAVHNEYELNLLKNHDVNIRLNKNVTCGLFDAYMGVGGVIALKLEKDVILEREDISLVQVETEREPGLQGYTVEQVFYLPASAWEKARPIETGKASPPVDTDAAMRAFQDVGQSAKLEDRETACL